MSDSRLMTFSVFLAKYSSIENSVFVRRSSVSPIDATKFLASIVISQSVIILLVFTFFFDSMRFMMTAIRAMSSRGENGFDT
jgi:hypothetical protein